MITRTEILDVYALAAALLEGPRARGIWAMNEDGADVSLASDEATCFCLAGAVHRAVYELTGIAWENGLEAPAPLAEAAFRGLMEHVPNGFLWTIGYDQALWSCSNWFESPERGRSLAEIRALISKAAHTLSAK